MRSAHHGSRGTVKCWDGLALATGGSVDSRHESVAYGGKRDFISLADSGRLLPPSTPPPRTASGWQGTTAAASSNKAFINKKDIDDEASRRALSRVFAGLASPACFFSCFEQSASATHMYKYKSAGKYNGDKLISYLSHMNFFYLFIYLFLREVPY